VFRPCDSLVGVFLKKHALSRCSWVEAYNLSIHTWATNNNFQICKTCAICTRYAPHKFLTIVVVSTNPRVGASSCKKPLDLDLPNYAKTCAMPLLTCSTFETLISWLTFSNSRASLYIVHLLDQSIPCVAIVCSARKQSNSKIIGQRLKSISCFKPSKQKGISACSALTHN
jgi:hypothetical protein